MKEIIKKFIPKFVLGWYHYGLAFLGAVLYRFPSKDIKVIGITGTDGKSTTVKLTEAVLKEGGFKVASLSSISFKIGDKEWTNKLKMTMPGRFKLQKFFRQAVNAGCNHIVLEVSSEGIKQHRHKFINFEAAVITNLSPEHIESHGGFDNYKKTKGKLFKAAKKIHVVNVDDENAPYFLSLPAKKIYTYGLNQGEINYKDVPFKLSLKGEFNKYNALAAICVGFSQGVSLAVCKKAVEKAKSVPGRMETVIKGSFEVVVDYAVTPNALEKVYKTLKPASGKMIGVFGACGGGRDKWKRPILGNIAERYCDYIILTNEDPYEENPKEILKDIEVGIKNIQGDKFYSILDRREAISRALSLARPGDVVVVTGKGCEPWMRVAQGKKIVWDDREVVKEEFKKLDRKQQKG